MSETGNQPPTPPAGAVVQVPLSWRFGEGTDQHGNKVCVLVVSQAAHVYQLALSPGDMERLCQDGLNTARQARTGLVVVGGSALPPGNGRPAGRG